DSRGRSQRDRRDRRQELLPPRWRGPGADRVGHGERRPAEALRAGRVDPDPAAGPETLPLAAQDTLAKDQRIPRLLRDGTALLQGPDPDPLRQRDLSGPRQ